MKFLSIWFFPSSGSYHHRTYYMYYELLCSSMATLRTKFTVKRSGMPTSVADIAALVLVGAFWGCTNPLLRQGSLAAAAGGPDPTTPTCWTHQLRKLRNVRVWLPYVVNQSGSLLFNLTLRQTELSLAVPVANALALVFSVLTTILIGEPLYQPFKTVIGAALVVGGVALCSWEATKTDSELVGDAKIQ